MERFHMSRALKLSSIYVVCSLIVILLVLLGNGYAVEKTPIHMKYSSFMGPRHILDGHFRAELPAREYLRHRG